MITLLARWSFLPVALALLLAVASARAAEPATGPTTAATVPAGDRLRVMSFNVRFGTALDGGNSWPFRRELLFKTIEAFGPDLLGTQEVLAFQGRQLHERLKGYDIVGVGRE